MKRLKIRLCKLLFLFVGALLLPASLLSVGAGMPALYGETYYAELPAMVERLSTAEGKKLVVVGSSSVAFGLSGAQLEEELASEGYEYTVCPFGLYGAVGVGAMLSLSLPELGEGDIVVLALEPTSETNSTYFGATAYWKCAESASSLLLAQNGSRTSALVGSYLGYLQERESILESGIAVTAEGVYAKASFDARCDLVYARAGNVMAQGYDSNELVDFAAVEIEEDFAEEVRAYVAAAEAQGAEVYLSFAPVNASAVTGTEDGIYDYFLRCCEAYGCTAISDPRDYILDSGWFYDSNFHLNTAGASVRTHQLAVDLLAAQGDYRIPFFDAPEMPAPVTEDTGDDTDDDTETTADEADFLYAPLGENAWTVTGLSEQGQTKTYLTLPATYQGKPVAAFTADVFSNNAILETVTLPASVESIPDNAFSGSPNLTRLVLLHRGTACDLGDSPFAGADQLTIVVPEEDYSLYRDGAGCEDNPWQAYIDRIVTE